MEDKQYYEMRDEDIQSGTGTKALNAIFEEIDDARTKKENPKILELGCGSGALMSRLIKLWNACNHTDLNIQGTDTNEYAIAVCKKRKLNAEIGDAENLKFKDNEFDIVIGQHILEYVDAEKAVKESLRVANKAIFLISDNLLNKEKRTKLFRIVPDEQHKLIKDIIKYTQHCITYRNHLIVFYKKKTLKTSKKEEKLKFFEEGKKEKEVEE